MRWLLLILFVLIPTQAFAWLSFTIITDTPGRLANALQSRGILDQNSEPIKRGLEIAEVPNPILIEEGPPTVYDTRRVFLVKFAHEFETDEKDGDGCDRKSLLLCTKLGKWIAANSVSDTITSADGRSWPASRVGTSIWFVDSPDFGVWQQ